MLLKQKKDKRNQWGIYTRKLNDIAMDKKESKQKDKKKPKKQQYTSFVERKNPQRTYNRPF